MRRALSHPLMRTEHTPKDLTHTLLVLLISGARLHLGAGPRLPTPRAVSAHGRTPNQHHFCDFMTNAEADPVAPTIPVAFSIPSFEPVPTHDCFVTCTVCPCQFASVVETIPFCSCRPHRSKSSDHGNNSKPAFSVGPPLVLWKLHAKIARVLLRTLERRLLQQQPLGKLSFFRLFCKSSLITSDCDFLCQLYALELNVEAVWPYP